MIENFLVEPSVLWKATTLVHHKMLVRDLHQVEAAIDEILDDMEDAEIDRRIKAAIGAKTFRITDPVSSAHDQLETHFASLADELSEDRLAAIVGACKATVDDIKAQGRRPDFYHGKAILDEFYRRHMHASGMSKEIFVYECARVASTTPRVTRLRRRVLERDRRSLAPGHRPLDSPLSSSVMTDRHPLEAPTFRDILELPDVPTPMGNMLDQVTTALGVPREVLASNDQIAEAWSRLPRLVSRIPQELRGEKVVRACIAVSAGLFDAAINYLWNASIVELRQKVRRFGLPVVSQILGDRSFDEDRLVDLKDAELLDLCLKLNLINDSDSFFLDQCRSTRNRFSVAHPAIGQIDEDELINFLSRCQKHALASTKNPRGVDTKQLLSALRDSPFTPTQREEWEARVRATFDAQRELIFRMLHRNLLRPVLQ